VAVTAQRGGERVVCYPAKKVVLLKEAPVHLLQSCEATMVTAQNARSVLAELACTTRPAAVVLGGIFLHGSSV
jgi:hypothetical protein